MVGQDFTAMKKLVDQLFHRADTEPFRDPVDWKGMGLFDYPQLIKKPMDLGTVRRKLEVGQYGTIRDAAEDIRLIWNNCKTYNADGSDFYKLAENLSKKFEDKFKKIADAAAAATTASATTTTEGAGAGADGGAAGAVSSVVAPEPTQEEKRTFAKSLYKITKEQLGEILVKLDEKCPDALTKNATEDEVEINVDNISPAVFHDLVDFVKSCSSGTGEQGRKKKTGGGNKAKKQKLASS